MTYKPSYDVNQVSEQMSPTGKTSKELAFLENQQQKIVAESEYWRIAKKVNFFNNDYVSGTDSKQYLEKMGVQIVGEDALFYHCIAPAGWTKSTEGYWTTVLDVTGSERISQFYKAAIYDTDTFVNLTDQ